MGITDMMKYNGFKQIAVLHKGPIELYSLNTLIKNSQFFEIKNHSVT